LTTELGRCLKIAFQAKLRQRLFFSIKIQKPVCKAGKLRIPSRRRMGPRLQKGTLFRSVIVDTVRLCCPGRIL
jgi:hypothetical protein